MKVCSQLCRFLNNRQERVVPSSQGWPPFVWSALTVRSSRQVYISKPLGFSFGRGNDGGAYVTKLDSAKGNIDEQVQVRVSS